MRGRDIPGEEMPYPCTETTPQATHAERAIVDEAEVDERGEWTRQAIDVMTAWASQDDGYGFAASRVGAYAAGDPHGTMKLTVGFINLSAILLLQLQHLSGTDVHRLLRDAAQITLYPAQPG